LNWLIWLGVWASAEPAIPIMNTEAATIDFPSIGFYRFSFVCFKLEYRDAAVHHAVPLSCRLNCLNLGYQTVKFRKKTFE